MMKINFVPGRGYKIYLNWTFIHISEGTLASL